MHSERPFRGKVGFAGDIGTRGRIDGEGVRAAVCLGFPSSTIISTLSSLSGLGKASPSQPSPQLDQEGDGTYFQTDRIVVRMNVHQNSLSGVNVQEELQRLSPFSVFPPPAYWDSRHLLAPDRLKPGAAFDADHQSDCNPHSCCHHCPSLSRPDHRPRLICT